MSVFESLRFAGNRILVEILEDPDTGTKKLREGSDAEAVAAVQNAVYDLHWAASFPDEDHYPTRERFVDGDYGRTTRKSVLAFKTKYHIVFPPDDPNGVLDGYTGPRTLERLDRQISFRDRMSEVILGKVGTLQAAGAPVRLFPETGEPPPLTPWLGTRHYVYWWTSWDDPAGTVTGIIVAGAEDDVFEVHGPIMQTWWDTGGAAGPYGPATSDVEPDGRGGYRSTFANGVISVDAEGAVTAQPGPIAYLPPTGGEDVFV